MLMRRFSLSVLLLLFLLSSCGEDNPTKPTPAETFELRIAVVDSSGAPVEGLQVSAWNVIERTEERNNTAQAHPVQFAATAVLPGDVDCDGTAYAENDLWLYHLYLFYGDSVLVNRGVLDCFMQNGDVVKESNGITIADYYRAFLDANGFPFKKRFQVYSLSYTYDELSGRIAFDTDLWGQGIRIAAVRIVASASKPGIVHDGDGCIDLNRRWIDSVTTAMFINWPFSIMSPCIDFIEDDLIELIGRIELIEGCTEYGDPVIFTRRAAERWVDPLVPQPAESSITLQIPYIVHPFALVVRDLHENVLDSLYVPSPEYMTDRVRQYAPNNGNPGVYIFDLLVQETPELLGRGRTFAAIWSDDPERNEIGFTNDVGVVASFDDLRFPALFLEDPIYGTLPDSMHPGVILGHDIVEYLDSIHVVVRDTLTDDTVEGTYPLVPGKNSVQVIWP